MENRFNRGVKCLKASMIVFSGSNKFPNKIQIYHFINLGSSASSLFRSKSKSIMLNN